MNFRELFDMFTYSLSSVQPCRFQPKFTTSRLFQHFGFSLDHHARSRRQNERKRRTYRGEGTDGVTVTMDDRREGTAMGTTVTGRYRTLHI